jgi:hypothetical protein
MIPPVLSDLSYAVWKTFQTYLVTLTITDVYYTENEAFYDLYLVLTSSGAAPSKGLVFHHSIDRLNAPVDALDFETTYQPTATLITTPNDAVALAIIAGP